MFRPYFFRCRAAVRHLCSSQSAPDYTGRGPMPNLPSDPAPAQDAATQDLDEVIAKPARGERSNHGGGGCGRALPGLNREHGEISRRLPACSIAIPSRSAASSTDSMSDVHCVLLNGVLHVAQTDALTVARTVALKLCTTACTARTRARTPHSHMLATGTCAGVQY